jgi:transcriptional regulator with XRE-family HTH domain
MNRKEFGELIATLRQDLGWTQFNLAEFAQVDEAVVSQVERGVKKHFEPELLYNLANAFQMTTMERRELLLAASGLDEREMVRQPSSQVKTDVFHPQKILGNLMHITGQLRLPAFVIDVYGDVVAANYIVMSLFQISMDWAVAGRGLPGGYNMMRVTFGRDLVTRRMVAENWDVYAINTMCGFREISLRYRAKPYFKYLLKAFRNPADFPLFDRYWKMVSSLEPDRESNADLFAYGHSRFGHLKYLVTSSMTVTPYGELFLVQYLPADEHTSEVFQGLAREFGQDVASFAPWPEKIIP